MEKINYLSVDFLDILFEGKNKEYGAYELRRKYGQRLRNALIATGMVCLLLIGGFALSNYLYNAGDKLVKPIEDVVKLKNLDLKPDVPPPPPPPPAPEPPPLKSQMKYTTLNVVKDEQVKPEEQPPDLDKIQDRVISTQTLEGDSLGIDPSLIPDAGAGVVEAVPAKEKIFVSVQQMPVFPGGETALMKYLRDHIHYPAVAHENGIQGIVVVQFIVGPDGTIRDVKTVGLPKGGGLEEEAVRVVKGMPAWKPGKQNGRPVTVQYHLPIHFMLQ